MKNVTQTTLWQWTGDFNIPSEDLFIIEKTIPNGLVAVKLLFTNKKDPSTTGYLSLKAKQLAEMCEYDENGNPVDLDSNRYFVETGSYYRTGLAFKGYEIFNKDFWSNNQTSIGTRCLLTTDYDAEYTYDQAVRIGNIYNQYDIPTGMLLCPKTNRLYFDNQNGTNTFV
jgi:hypothetical protein